MHKSCNKIVISHDVAKTRTTQEGTKYEHVHCLA